MTPAQLAEIDATKEVLIETSSGDTSSTTTIWVVIVDDEVYVRSVDGEAGRWYRRARSNRSVALMLDHRRIEFTAVGVNDPEIIDAVSDAFRSKYRPGVSLDRMTRDEVLATTLRLDPAS